VKKNNFITRNEYSLYSKYFSLIEQEKILELINRKIANYIKKNKLTKFDYFFKFIELKYIDIFFLDFLSKFFFKKSIIRFQLNIILAVHESEYSNFKNMINKSNIFEVIIDFINLFWIVPLSPFWLLYIIIRSKFIKYYDNK
jgi:hypothetical protein